MMIVLSASLCRSIILLIQLSSQVSISKGWQLKTGLFRSSSVVVKPTVENLDYDCIIVGSGASGMFASGATSMFFF